MVEYSLSLPKSLASPNPNSKVRLNREHNLYVRNDDGLRGLGKFYPIVELLFDSNNKLLVRYRTKDRSEGALTYGYEIVGKLVEVPPKKEEEVGV